MQDVIVVGAGPAGCAAAIALAESGVKVTLVERLGLPQPKACGDTLHPGALATLARLGVTDEVTAAGLALEQLSITAPSRVEVLLAGRTVTMPRPRLHAILQQRARCAGAILQSGEVLGPLREGERLCGVEVRAEQGEVATLRAPLVILASGARPGVAPRFGLDERSGTTAVAIRAYYRDLSGRFADKVRLCCHRELLPGFGWVVPLPDGIYNIGFGRYLRSERAEQLDLPRMLDYFISAFLPARLIALDGDLLGSPCSALMRTGMNGARPFAPGVLATGEIIGTTSPLSGAGVGAALESGLAAAATAGEALAAGRFDGHFLSRYSTRLDEGCGGWLREGERAGTWLDSPWKINLLARRAAANEPLRRRLSGVWQGDVPQRKVFSLWRHLI